MAQSIKVKIGGTEFPFTVDSPEQERRMRTSAEKINRILSAYNERYPGVSHEDKLVFILLGEMVSTFRVEDEVAALKSEIEELKQLTDSYLEAQK